MRDAGRFGAGLERRALVFALHAAVFAPARRFDAPGVVEELGAAVFETAVPLCIHDAGQAVVVVFAHEAGLDAIGIAARVDAPDPSVAGANGRRIGWPWRRQRWQGTARRRCRYVRQVLDVPQCRDDAGLFRAVFLGDLHEAGRLDRPAPFDRHPHVELTRARARVTIRHDVLERHLAGTAREHFSVFEDA